METPILFLIYNRPEYTKKVFEAIRRARPKKLFISADGPKMDKEGDDEMCNETRKIVERIDWPCETKTMVGNENLGCRLGVIKGPNWFFENVEEGIILEDDCLPNESFFEYCEKLLKKFRNKNEIMMISGSNPATSITSDYDYFFSRFYHIWGWATWKRAWSKYDVNVTEWPRLKKERLLEKVFPTNIENRMFVEKMIDQVYGKVSSVWSIQWTYTCLLNNGYAVLPKYNLISNIGLVGVHEMNEDQLFIKTKKIDFANFSHPKTIGTDQAVEDLIFKSSGLSKI